MQLSTPENGITILLVIVLWFVIHWLINWHKPFPGTFKAVFYEIEVDGSLTRIEDYMIQVQAGKPKNLALVFEDGFGNITNPDGTPVWSTTGLTSLIVAEKGLTAVFGNSGKVESGQITVTGDLDRSGEIKPFIATLDFTIIPGDAVTVRVEVLPDTPTPPITPEPA